ncbi:MAG: plasmid partitioning protein RepB [Methylocystis sp.]|nr:plasmid partitioning protein RepB [Methylocystis sp.]MCA3584973.1 plasmid partitioning protein RepB [Methylocystis sp.]MCA3586903.1 plasmid partitioning protein RepB [Methylocystis sp.]MCA3592191.1 plasmid partitioning protein RepB [Methylocystis sp.]
MSKRTDAIRSMFTQAPETKALSPDNPAAESPRRTAGAVNSIRSTFSDIERENEALRAAVGNAERIVEIEASLIDPSPFPDRFADDGGPSFAQLRASLAERGQEVPVLLRPHPTAAGRYQTAFGHRRIRALRELGRPVRALVRTLSDDDLAAAQGVENAARADLSFIERAVFALRLEEAGRPRLVVQQALAIDKAEASKLIAVARSIPMPVITAIGKAGRAGRPRWQALAEALGHPEALARVQAFAAEPAFAALDSDSRFVAAFEAARRPDVAAAIRQPIRTDIRSGSGEVIAKLIDAPGASQITIDRREHGAFADFVAQQLPDLFERFRANGNGAASRCAGR